MEFNFSMLLLTGVVPLLVGYVWYLPNVFGRRLYGDEANNPEGPHWSVFVLTYLFGVFASYMMFQLSVHQFSIFQLFAMEPELSNPDSAIAIELAGMMERFHGDFRSWHHGLIHATETTIGFVLPVIGTIGMFERKGWKYIWIHVGYWGVTLIIITSILCQFM